MPVPAHAQKCGDTTQDVAAVSRDGCHGGHGQEDARSHHEDMQAAEALAALHAPHLVREESVQEDGDHMAGPPEWQLGDEVVKC